MTPKTTKPEVVKSHTGTIHARSETWVSCNTNAHRRARYVVLSVAGVEAQPEEKFCRRCFVHGKAHAVLMASASGAK
jgi:hypothetical protein